MEYQRSMDINARDKVNNLPLHFALSRGNMQEAEELLRKGANPNSIDKEGWTPLHLICERRGDEDVQARMLFELSSEKYQPVQVNVQNDEGNTPLHGATINNMPKVVKLLLKNGSDPNLFNKNGETPLHNICKRIRIKKASATLLRTNLALNDLKNRMKVAKSLLRRGSNPNLVDKNGSTPLFIICNGALENWEHSNDTQLRSGLKKHEKKLVKLLLRKGADPNVANIKGLTPLHICLRRFDSNYNDDFAKPFFKICGKMGWPTLQWAVANLFPDMVDELLDRGADLSSFVFPTASQFFERYEVERHEGYCKKRSTFKFKLASGALTVTERLTNRGYELKRNDTLAIMKLFAECQIFEKSDNCDKCWYDDEDFWSKAEQLMVNKSLWLDELIKLRPEEAEKLLTCTDYFNLTRTPFAIPGEHFDDCYLHLCEKLSRGFFRRRALDPFWELIHKRLPLECCEMVLENLNNEDLYNICLAAAGQSS